MSNKYLSELYNENIPLVFTDGTKVYDELKQNYKTHEKGYFIYGPSGVGKTYFIERQITKDWIDGDVLWSATKAFPNNDWWNLPGDQIDEIERRADVITEQAKRLGFWIIGASSVNVIPDAIVLPDFDTHLKYIQHRENNNYDGGMKSDNIERIKKNRDYYSRFSKYGVPIFDSVDKAVDHIVNQMDK